MKTLLPILLASAAFAAPAAGQTAPATPDIAALQAQIEAMQAQLDELKAAQEAAAAKAEAAPAPAAKISWKGAPVIEGDGWSFKPRGRLMYDFGHVSRPAGYENAGLGFSNELRRGRLGVEGKLPGNFGYKLELDFAAGDPEFTDAYLSYSKGPWEVIVGQHNGFQSLEELTSSLHTAFIERAAFTDAFNFERRVGISGQFEKKALLVQAGVFTDNIADLNSVGDDNDSWGFDTRAVFMPKMGKNQLHFAGSFHHRDLNDSATSVRYRQRPAIHTTDVRFVDTGSIADAESETAYGLEAAGIFGPFYVASEAYWQKVGRMSGLPDPTFFGAYVDAGYFFTGESRGYKGGKFDRVKVKRPLDKGGWGSLGANIRFDHLDLNDAGIMGGKQNAYQASLNWKPMDYLMFGLNYAHIVYSDAAIATPAGDRDYSVDMIGLRSQVDF
ncbi:MAG TPA: OprO/OprP family phosphate-selective porin [Sphingomicrobium sp.]|nr:OprO/OprP family phosphate-selective porin [Sphingomicrobium sp.]